MHNYAVTVKFAIEVNSGGEWHQIGHPRDTLADAKAFIKYEKSWPHGMFYKFRVVQVITHESRVVVRGA